MNIFKLLTFVFLAFSVFLQDVLAKASKKVAEPAKKASKTVVQ